MARRGNRQLLTTPGECQPLAASPGVAPEKHYAQVLTAMDVEETARLIVMLAREREKDFAAARGNA